MRLTKLQKATIGITLVVLVITVVLLLIITGVAVNILVDEDLFNKTEKTVKEANQKTQQENSTMDNMVIDWNKMPEGIKSGTGEIKDDTGEIKDPELDKSKLKIGDFVDYTPDKAANYMGFGTSTIADDNPSGSTSNPTDGIPQENLTTMKWRILSINDDGSVDMVSEQPILTTVYLEGVKGYNNGVYLLNDLCAKQYSNTTLGVIARSMNIVDIEKQLNETGLADRDAYTLGIQYGATNTYEDLSLKTPDIYKHVEKTAEEESKDYYTTPTTETYTEETSLDVQQTYYFFYNLPATYFKSSVFRDLVCGTGKGYWIASRYANCGANYVDFGLRRVNSVGGLAASQMFLSDVGDQPR